jgi:hypothetical protein
MMNNRILWIPTLAVALLLSSCATTRIARINADPSRYRNRSVTITGNVTTAAGLLGTGGYQVDDGSGRIYVISGTGVPSRGARVKVTGRVISGANILGLSVGTAIREQHHKLSW